MAELSRRDVIKGGWAIAVAGAAEHSRGQKIRSGRLGEAGWVWEGQGINRYIMPSIYGVGDGARYFGLNKVVFMFHPNTAFAMEKLRWCDQVACDISKWKFRGQSDGSVLKHHDGRLATKLQQANVVSRLSREYANIAAGYDDDLLGTIKKEGTTPEQYAQVYTQLKQSNPKLKLQTVVYSHELGSKKWMEFSRYMDVISLWVWKPEDLLNLDRYVDQCRTVFPDKSIHLGCYIKDYNTHSSMPLELLKFQWNRLPSYLESGKINGYEVIEAVIIDQQRRQARWVRDFIHAN